MISVVVPAYNAERYIGKCIKSVISQTYRDIELILVNDCSTDATLDVCKRFAATDKRIVIVDKPKNEGEGAARYSGVVKATGKWTTFVDADDTLAPGSLQTMASAAQQHKVDMVMGNMRITAFGQLYKRDYLLPSQFTGRAYRHDELMDMFYLSFFGVSILPVTMWGKLYLTDMVRQELRPAGLKFGEDLLFNMRLFPRLESVYFVPDVVYNYRQGSGATSRFMPYWIDDVKTLYREKQREMAAHNFTDRADRTTRVELVECLLTYIEQFITFKRSDRQANIAALQEELHDEIYSELVAVEYTDAEVVEAIKTKDAARLYARVEYRLAHAPLKAKAKRLVRLILRHFS